MPKEAELERLFHKLPQLSDRAAAGDPAIVRPAGGQTDAPAAGVVARGIPGRPTGCAARRRRHVVSIEGLRTISCSIWVARLERSEGRGGPPDHALRYAQSVPPLPEFRRVVVLQALIASDTRPRRAVALFGRDYRSRHCIPRNLLMDDSPRDEYKTAACAMPLGKRWTGSPRQSWRWCSIVVIAAVLAAATVLESAEGREYAQWYVYKSPWFMALLGLLALEHSGGHDGPLSLAAAGRRHSC